MSVVNETYPAPEHGWTCFHCGETFTKYGLAALHFGERPSATPACLLDLGVLMDLRAAEARVDELETMIGQAKRILFFATSKPRRITVRDDVIFEL